MLLYMEQLQAIFGPFTGRIPANEEYQTQIEGDDGHPSEEHISLVWVSKRSAGLCEIRQRLGIIAVVGEIGVLSDACIRRSLNISFNI